MEINIVIKKRMRKVKNMKKKELLNLIENEGILKINKFTLLNRMLKDVLNNDVDILRIEISINSYCEYVEEIISRTYEEIIEEIQQHQEKAFINCANKLNKQLKNGYTC